jgi:formylglycine-generating enzyme
MIPNSNSWYGEISTLYYAMAIIGMIISSTVVAYKYFKSKELTRRQFYYAMAVVGIILACTVIKCQCCTTKQTPRPPEMVFVQGGAFQMGSDDLAARPHEKPVHTVIVRSFYISKCEVTQAEWRLVMGSDPVNLKFKGCDNCPVETVSLNDAQQYLSKLNQLSGKRYRLPTEAEWEYAARGGHLSKGYPYSGSKNLNEVAWHQGNSEGKTHPVGKKKPNELGLYDMTGNVWEWCSDWYDENYYSQSPDRDPMNAAKDSFRVNRGGGWSTLASLYRITHRSRDLPAMRYNNLGFRIVSP